jgi:hypothetical protein
MIVKSNKPVGVKVNEGKFDRDVEKLYDAKEFDKFIKRYKSKFDKKDYKQLLDYAKSLNNEERDFEREDFDDPFDEQNAEMQLDTSREDLRELILKSLNESVNEGRVEKEVLQKISKFETLLGYITNDDQYKPLVSKVKKEIDKLKKQIKKNESVNEGRDVGHYERIGNQTIVDSNFVNYSKGILPNSKLVHLGMGDFALKTPNGDITFARSGKIDGAGQDFVGRPHRVTDKSNGKLVDELIKAMVKKKKAVLSMSESLKEAYVIFYAKKKGDKPSQAAYRDKDMALKFEKDLKKDGYITMVTQKKIKGVDESINEEYYKSASDAADAARKYAEKKGFEIDEDDWQTQIAMGGKHNRLRPGVGKTHSFSVGLVKNGKPQRKMLQISIFGMPSGKYELTQYIN